MQQCPSAQLDGTGDLRVAGEVRVLPLEDLLGAQLGEGVRVAAHPAECLSGIDSGVKEDPCSRWR